MEHDYLYSPFVTYPKNTEIIKITNSLGEEFHLAKLAEGKQYSDAVKDTEVAKYPLSQVEVINVFDRIRLQSAVQNTKKYRFSLREADLLFQELGIYFRLGLLHSPEQTRFNVLRAYSRLYGFCFRNDYWTELDVKEFQSFADTGMSLSEISAQMNRPYQNLVAAKKRYGIVMARKSRKYTFWSENDLKILKDNLGQMSYQELQEKFFPDKSIRNLIETARKYFGGKRNVMRQASAANAND